MINKDYNTWYRNNYILYNSNGINLFGITLYKIINKPKLLKEKEYHKRIKYKNNIYFAEFPTILRDKIFFKGTRKLISFLKGKNNLESNIFLLLYYMETNKLNIFKNSYYGDRKYVKYGEYIKKLNTFNEIKVDKIKKYNGNYLRIKYKEYFFYYFVDSVTLYKCQKNINRNLSNNTTVDYVIQYDKLFDLIYDKFGDEVIFD